MPSRSLFLIFAVTTTLAHAGQQEAVPGAVIVPFTLEKPGQVSAAIYDAKGLLVRELFHAAPKSAGKHVFFWDGRDREGQPLPTGAYSWKLLQTPGLEATYLMGVGSNFPPGIDWATACGPGTHSTPSGIAVDKSGIYVAAHTTENIETCMLKMSHDGKKRLWSALHPRPWDGATSLAVDSGEVYMLGHVRTEDGRIEPVLRRKQLVYVFDAATGKLAPRTVSGSAVGPIPIALDVQWDPAANDLDGTDMDAHEGVLIVAYQKRDVLRWYDAKSGKLLDTVKIPSPQGVAVARSDVVFVTTGDRIMKLTRGGQGPVEIVKGLDKPGRIDVDHGSGQLLVYLTGTQQIQRISYEGKILSTYGVAGGRKEGLYDARARRSFAGFADLCADGAGGFYVTESGAAPRRTAHFNRAGDVVEEWYGGQRWAPHAAPEGDNPNVLWVGSHYGWIMRVLVDYENRSWSVHSCYKYVGLGDGMVGDSHNEGCYFRVYKHGGATYIALERLPTILKVDDKNWRLLPATVCGGVSHAPKFIQKWAGKQTTFQWNDANGDGLAQRNEVTFYAGSMPSSYEPYIAQDFTCFTVHHEAPRRKVYRFPVESWTEAGAPVYGNMPTGIAFADCPARFDPAHFADSRWSVFLHKDARSGKLFAAFNDWTRDWCDYADSFMHQWSSAGVSEWTAGKRGQGAKVPGEVYMHLRGVAGAAHDCVVAIDANGGWYGTMANTYVWDKDGLFVGGLMDRPHLKGIEKFWYQCGGEFCHAAVHTLPSGDVLFFGNWENEVRVYRITGWKGWQRQQGRIELTKSPPTHGGPGLAACAFDDEAMTKLADALIAPGIVQGKPPGGRAIRWSGTIFPDYGPAYLGPWTVRADKDSFKGSQRGSRDNSATVTFRFKGTSIAVVGSTGPNHGLAEFLLDGKPQPRFDCYSAKPGRDVTFFSKSDLAPGNHEMTVKVVGWFAQPRNKASSDAWVFVDKFMVDGQNFDDAGMSYTLTVDGEGKRSLWIDRRPVLDDKNPSKSTVTLLRQPYSFQMDYRPAGKGITLNWSGPMLSPGPIPSANLYPVLPGGHVMFASSP